ncbi:MAG TPA: FecR domain-containing protein [Steroidobacteraceae bacterium]|nr:FecR domain-containing protein [Steroidobacteraceae bacterium]
MFSENENPLRDPTALPPAQGAAYWLATLSDESCSDAERQQFSQWLRASTRNVEEFLRLSTLTRTASRHGDLWPDSSVESLIAQAQASSNVATLESRRADATPARRALPWLIAASVAVVAIGVLMTQGTSWQSWFDDTYRTAVGEQRSITLEDGSVVELNTNSQLRARYSGSLRAVELLDGEAIFRVTKDAHRPFRVRTGATDIVAVGTAFNVNADDQRTIVTVLEGRVRVDSRVATAAAGGAQLEPIMLDIGQQLIVAPARPVVRVSLPGTEKVTSWTQRRLMFEDTSIADAAAEFARYSSRQIRIVDAAIAARRVTGVFDAADPASLIEFLRADATVAVAATGDGWIVRANSMADPAARQ